MLFPLWPTLPLLWYPTDTGGSSMVERGVWQASRCRFDSCPPDYLSWRSVAFSLSDLDRSGWLSACLKIASATRSMLAGTGSIHSRLSVSGLTVAIAIPLRLRINYSPACVKSE